MEYASVWKLVEGIKTFPSSKKYGWRTLVCYAAARFRQTGMADKDFGTQRYGGVMIGASGCHPLQKGLSEAPSLGFQGLLGVERTFVCGQESDSKCWFPGGFTSPDQAVQLVMEMFIVSKGGYCGLRDSEPLALLIRCLSGQIRSRVGQSGSLNLYQIAAVALGYGYEWFWNPHPVNRGAFK
ncbi:hypothetical protein CEXT_397191 [Caerostris extrusa]|uniref:Uncharacterized protein n=1 Tax=Caerostris extrusa TaxID=172846 RepID=A0AAV4PLH4_CAEEX|nr:hypothetical protein CEXT_397191 [Caerostris extrusa]